MQLSRLEFTDRFAFFAIGLVLFPAAVALGGDSTAAQSEQLVNVAAPQIILAPQSGDGKVDREIARLQQAVRNASNPNLLIERLGWTFVAKARQSFDPGYYKLAEQCAVYLDSRQPGSCEALLLRGHVLHNLHCFKAAEPLARELATKRGLACDFGLLGDVLMEQGRLKEAAKAYQTMLDLKPSLHSYARAAHLRWLKGDLTGAIEAMQLAVAASSPQDAESAAWVNTRLASYQFQAGDNNEARRTADIALTYQHDYAPALLLRGCMKLSEEKSDDATAQIQTATQLNPLPEYRWALADALREAGRESDALNIEQLLTQTGAADDPRTYALYLATRCQLPETAVRLTESELKERADIFTHDAAAWSLARAGRIDDALTHLGQALADGTKDARLFFHAAVIHSKAGHKEEASRFFEQATRLTHLLLPSERQQLQLVPGAINNDFADSMRPVTGARALNVAATESPRRD